MEVMSKSNARFYSRAAAIAVLFLIDAGKVAYAATTTSPSRSR
jgi:hypothetical protein